MVTVDQAKHEVRVGRKEVFLTPREYRLLTALLTQKGYCLSREELFKKVWGNESANSRTIDQHIARIRNKIGRDVIRTITGYGYKMVTGKIRS